MCPVLSPVMYFFSALGTLGALWIIIAAVVFFRGDRRAGVYMALSLIFSLIVSNLIVKNIVARPRPFELIEGFAPLMGRFSDASGFSFPSAHASSSFAAAFALAASKGKKGALAFIPAALIAIARVYIGAHFLTDIVCGALFGIVSALLAGLIVKRIRKL